MGRKSRFNIQYNKFLKEFIVKNPPTFNISDLCCEYAKKKVIKEIIKNTKADLNIYGVRRAEGGARSTAYKTCYDNNIGIANYRPIFWYKDSDKLDYEKSFNITHSSCYTQYGLKRTGCAACPFGKNYEQELFLLQKYEPKLFRAVSNIFSKSYEYTKKYKEFCLEQKEHVW